MTPAEGNTFWQRGTCRTAARIIRYGREEVKKKRGKRNKIGNTELSFVDFAIFSFFKIKSWFGNELFHGACQPGIDLT